MIKSDVKVEGYGFLKSGDGRIYRIELQVADDRPDSVVRYETYLRAKNQGLGGSRYKCVKVEFSSSSPKDDQITDAADKLASEGYTVVSLTPIIRGNYEVQKEIDGSAANWAAAYGYSVTDSFLILGEKK